DEAHRRGGRHGRVPLEEGAEPAGGGHGEVAGGGEGGGAAGLLGALVGRDGARAGGREGGGAVGVGHGVDAARHQGVGGAGDHPDAAEGDLVAGAGAARHGGAPAEGGLGGQRQADHPVVDR